MDFRGGRYRPTGTIDESRNRSGTDYFGDGSGKYESTDDNMYELLNFSYDNRYYLFFNRRDVKL